MKPFVYITRKLPDDIISPLKEVANVEMWESTDKPVPKTILMEKVKQAEGLLTMVSDKVDQSVLEQASNLKVVANMAVGYDNIDVDYATRKSIFVCNTPDVLSDTTADLAFALLMAVARRIVEGNSYIKQGLWKEWSPYLLAGHDIHHKKIGIVGMGRIGEKVAKRATGFEMEILYHNRSRKEATEKELGATFCSFEELLSQADFVVCLAPLTDETKHLFNGKAFSKMKKSAIFINAGRGLVVDEEALIHALRNKEIAGAGLDVFSHEPIDQNHPLLQFENVVALPHIGSASMETRDKMMALAIENISNVMKGNLPEVYVNQELETILKGR